MTADTERFTETPEVLLESGREHLLYMRHLADQMVFMYGQPQDDSHTMVWQSDGNTYFLGRGGEHWETLAESPQTDENWLYILNDETNEQAAHLISPRNETLAGNSKHREEVAAILRRHMGDRLVQKAAELFAGNPGEGSMFLPDDPGSGRYTIRVYGEAAHPFMFVKGYANRIYQVAGDVGIEPLDPAAPFKWASALEKAATAEEQLLMLTHVLYRGGQDDKVWKEPEEEIYRPESLSKQEADELVETYGILRSWFESGEHGESDVWQPNEGTYAFRAIMSDPTGRSRLYGIVVEESQIHLEGVIPNVLDWEMYTASVRTLLTASGARYLDHRKRASKRGPDAASHMVKTIEYIKAQVAAGVTSRPTDKQVGQMSYSALRQVKITE
jgi:hypothetical protein